MTATLRQRATARLAAADEQIERLPARIGGDGRGEPVRRLIVQVVGYILLDGDLIKHDRAEGAAESELAAIYGRLGQTIPTPDPARVKAPQNYGARVIVTILTLGIYHFWWLYNEMVDGNRHFEINWPWEYSLGQAAAALTG